MPEISRFFGIVVHMYVNDHEPAHFHARYAGRNVVVDIRTLRVVRGRIHPRALGLLMEWASLHRDDLQATWSMARSGVTPGKIPPLG